MGKEDVVKTGTNRRGLSTIVANVLIVLVAVGAVSLLWVGISPMLAVDVMSYDTSVSLVTSGGYTFYDEFDESVTVQVESSGSEAPDYIQIILTLEDGNELISAHDAPPLNGRMRYYLNVEDYVDLEESTNHNPPVLISVAPMFIIEGEVILGQRSHAIELPKRVESDPEEFYGDREKVSPTSDQRTGAGGGGGGSGGGSGGESGGGSTLAGCEYTTDGCGGGEVIEVTYTQVDITDCERLEDPYNEYTLQNDVYTSSQSDCFVLGGDNIILDLNGKTIVSSSDVGRRGINIESGVENIVIKNGAFYGDFQEVFLSRGDFVSVEDVSFCADNDEADVICSDDTEFNNVVYTHDYDNHCPSNVHDCSSEVEYIDSCQATGWESGKYYVLQNDLNMNGDCFEIGVGGVTLDLNKKTVQGSGGLGIGVWFAEVEDSIVKSGSITGFDKGLFVDDFKSGGSDLSLCGNVLDIDCTYSGDISLSGSIYSTSDSHNLCNIPSAVDSCPIVCGDGKCESGETVNNCPDDCLVELTGCYDAFEDGKTYVLQKNLEIRGSNCFYVGGVDGIVFDLNGKSVRDKEDIGDNAVIAIDNSNDVLLKNGNLFDSGFGVSLYSSEGVVIEDLTSCYNWVDFDCSQSSLVFQNIIYESDSGCGAPVSAGSCPTEYCGDEICQVGESCDMDCLIT
jgi:hypothetical protein